MNFSGITLKASCQYQVNFYQDGEFSGYTAAVGFSGIGSIPYGFGATTIVAVQVWSQVGGDVVVGLAAPFVTSGSQPVMLHYRF